MPILESECASHPAAAGVWHFIMYADFLKYLFFGIHFHEGFVMTVAVNKRRCIELGRTKIGSFLVEELTEQERLLAEALCQRMIRKHVFEFVPECCRTTRLQHDHWSIR